MSASAFAYRPVRWPIAVGVLAIVVGLAMLIGAAFGFRYAGTIAAASPAEAALAVGDSAPATAEAVIVVPPAAMHLSDLRALFKLAAEKRLSLGSIDYQTESNRPAGVLVKRVALHVDDEYPKLKSFVAELLRSMPHLQLEQIQIEQVAGPQPASRVQATLTLAVMYRADESEPAAKRAAGP